MMPIECGLNGLDPTISSGDNLVGLLSRYPSATKVWPDPSAARVKFAYYFGHVANASRAPAWRRFISLSPVLLTPWLRYCLGEVIRLDLVR